MTQEEMLIRAEVAMEWRKANEALRAEVERLREMNGNQHRRIAELEAACRPGEEKMMTLPYSVLTNRKEQLK